MYLPVPRSRGKNTTLLSSMTIEGMGPSLAVEGSTTAAVFETYVEQVLLPSLKPGQIVIVDDLGAHRPARIRELIEDAGCELLYLPAYSPDFNPIEEACSLGSGSYRSRRFAKIKAILRRVAARGREALVEAMGSSLSAVSSEDAPGFFEHAGYRKVMGQLS